LIWSPPPPPLPRYARRFFLLRPPLFFSIELFYCQNSYIQKFSICQNSQNLEILNIQKFSKSRNSQYTKISKTPIKDLVVVLYVFNLDVVCPPFFYLFIYIYTKSEKGGQMESRYIAFFAALANYWNSQYTEILNIQKFSKSRNSQIVKLLKFSIYRNSQNLEILNIPKIWDYQKNKWSTNANKIAKAGGKKGFDRLVFMCYMCVPLFHAFIWNIY